MRATAPPSWSMPMNNGVKPALLPVLLISVMSDFT